MNEEMKQEEIQLEMEESFRNMSKNDYDNVNTHYTIKYSLYQIDPTAPRTEKCSGMDYNLEQINTILILLHVFGCNITNNGFEKRNELEFEIENERAAIIVFNNRFDCSALLPSAPSLMITVDQCRTVFDLNKIGTRFSNHVLECIFNGIIMPKILVIVAKRGMSFHSNRNNIEFLSIQEGKPAKRSWISVVNVSKCK